uniref:Uncharacterized protein n=1 Tax=Rhizophora mucronata TaxID=61149 RepID=A0A2P2PAC3_RHIMU
MEVPSCPAAEAVMFVSTTSEMVKILLVERMLIPCQKTPKSTVGFS